MTHAKDTIIKTIKIQKKKKILKEKEKEKVKIPTTKKVKKIITNREHFFEQEFIRTILT